MGRIILIIIYVPISYEFNFYCSTGILIETNKRLKSKTMFRTISYKQALFIYFPLNSYLNNWLKRVLKFSSK